MNRINYRRVVGGGLLAGAVLAIGEILLATLLEDRLRAAMDAFGTASFTPQNHAHATVTHTLTKEDGRIDWTRPAQCIHNLVRAANPWPMAQCVLGGEVCKIHHSTVVDTDSEEPPGTITSVEKDRVVVATGESGLAILTFQAPGKKAMSIP